MVDKVFGQDFTYDANPDGTFTISLNNGVTLVDVALEDLIHAILDTIDGTHGAVLYRGSSEWEALAPGTDGQVLTAKGADQDPEWDDAAAGGGSVDSVRTKYRITPSVASNNLTVAIKYIDGNDPTASNTITFRVGNTEYTLSGSVSYTKNAATNWHNSGGSEVAGQDVDYFVYAIGETGASAGLKFGHSRIPHAKTMGDFVNTTTSEKYIAGNWTNFNSTDPVTVIGRFKATLSSGPNNWTIPNAKVVDYPIYETDLLVWTPVVTGFSALPTNVSRYRLVGRICFLGYSDVTDGTSNATTFTATAPFIARNTSNFYQYSAVPWLKDNNSSAGAPGLAWASPNSRTIQMMKSGFTAWTASGNKQAAFTIFMEIE